MERQLRFGVINERVADASEWLHHVRRIEAAGIDTLLLRDHFSVGAFGPQLAPFSAVATAAAVTEQLNVGTLVIANDFRPPVLVAHEAATLSLLSGGRFELGMGAGWYEPEYEAAGIPFSSARRRIDRLDEALAIVRGLLDGDTVHLSGAYYQIPGLDLGVLPVPRKRPRIVVGAGGPRMLRVAARHADTVALMTAPITSSTIGDNPVDRLPQGLERQLDVLRTAAGDRFDQLELAVFVTLRITDDRRSGTEELIAERGWSGIDPEQVWTMPTVHIGSKAQIREDLEARRDRFGLSYLLTSDRDLPVLGELVAEL